MRFAFIILSFILTIMAQAADRPAPSPGGSEPISAAKAKQVMTSLKFGLGRLLIEIDHCSAFKCSLREFAYAKDSCGDDDPTSACPELNTVGEIRFAPGGFFFNEYGTTKSNFCSLNFDSLMKQWELLGEKCNFLHSFADERSSRK